MFVGLKNISCESRLRYASVVHAAVVNLGAVSVFAVIVVVQSFRVRDRVAYLWLHGCAVVVEVRIDVVCGRGTRRIFGADGQ